MYLGETTPQVQPLDVVREAPITKGINVNDPEPCRSQHLSGLGVAEGESSSGKDAHKRRFMVTMTSPTRGFQGGSGIPWLDVEVGGAGSQIHDRLKVDVFRNEVPQPGNLGCGVLPFPRRHETEVARRHEDGLSTRDLSEHRDAQAG